MCSVFTSHSGVRAPAEATQRNVPTPETGLWAPLIYYYDSWAHYSLRYPVKADGHAQKTHTHAAAMSLLSLLCLLLLLLLLCTARCRHDMLLLCNIVAWEWSRESGRSRIATGAVEFGRLECCNSFCHISQRRRSLSVNWACDER